MGLLAVLIWGYLLVFLEESIEMRRLGEMETVGDLFGAECCLAEEGACDAEDEFADDGSTGEVGDALDDGIEVVRVDTKGFSIEGGLPAGRVEAFLCEHGLDECLEA